MNIWNRLYPLSARNNNLFVDISIAQRLTLGFLAAALIATVVAGGIGVLRAQSLSSLSAFYQNLLQAKDKLTTGTDVLHLMAARTYTTIDLATTPGHSQEDLNLDMHIVQNLASLCDNILQEYTTYDMLETHPDQVMILQEAGHGSQVQQQRYLLGSVVRTWHFYRNIQQESLRDVQRGDLRSAQNLERLTIEPAIDDALSALGELRQFEDSLARSVGDSVQVEEQSQFLATIFGAVFASVGIALVGLFISSALVHRLKQVRDAAQAMQKGNLSERVNVAGRDEIADISASVNAMLGIIAAEKEAGTASELRDQFIASVSHELRNPLTGVFGWLDLLRDHQGQLDAATQARFLNNAIFGCQELTQLIDNILDSTRIDHQARSPHPEEIPVARLVQELVKNLDPREIREHIFQINIPAPLVIWADQQYLTQILRNLLSNALKYSPKQTSITIDATSVTQAEASEQVYISVQDAGPGIPPDEITHIFQKFSRLKRDMDGSIRGTGLGLYISKQLVEEMQGRIWAESTGIPGEGSCFYVALPVPTHRSTNKQLVESGSQGQ